MREINSFINNFTSAVRPDSESLKNNKVRNQVADWV